MKLTRPLDSGLTLVAEVCDECGGLGAQLLDRVAAAATALRSGETTIELDWATLRLRVVEREVHVGEPELGASARFSDSIVRTSRALLAGQELMRRLAIAPLPVSVEQRVRIASDALSATSIVGVREAETDQIASGWQLTAATEKGNEQFGLYTVRQVAEQWPHWCAALALPAGWAFRFVGRTLLDCVSPDGKTHEVMLSIDY